MEVRNSAWQIEITRLEFGNIVVVKKINYLMKKTLIILVLLFSSSLFAGDDLTGKKILCIRIVDVARIMSFDFVSNKAVEYSSTQAGLIKLIENYGTIILVQ